MVGQTISHYKVLDKLGQGGMGVVYRAQDTKLDRTVALKFLPAHLLGDEDIRKRFEREAKAAASLHHPNICPVYEIDDVDEKAFIAMAFIEGESLDKKIEQGPLKLDQALAIAQQVAQGLEAAHEKGIHHRDIKPENLMVDAKGHVTIMDFGLAQLTEASRLTRTDETLGTTSYMSPEQTEGSGTDHRTDIWALGVVLYEMIVGDQPFKGDYDKAIMYSILNEEPEPITALRTGVPMELEVGVGKCLEKEPQRRYQNTADLVVDLENIGRRFQSGRSTVARVASLSDRPTAPSSSPPRASSRERWAWAIAAICLIGFVGSLTFSGRGSVSAPEGDSAIRRFSFTPDSLVTFGNRVGISPNGRHIVYAVERGGVTKLEVRDLNSEQPRELAGTDGAQRPFWSPDSRMIGFASDGELKKIPVSGGEAATICPLPSPIFRGGAWSPGGREIVFSSGDSAPTVLYQVPALGGRPEPLPGLDQTLPKVNPHFLPLEFGRAILYEHTPGRGARVHLFNIETAEEAVVGEGGRPVYHASGHVLSEIGNPAEVWAQPISVEEMKPTGQAFPVVRNAGEPSVSADGVLTFVHDFPFNNAQIVWRDRQGRRLGVVGSPRRGLNMLALGPNDRQAAFVAVDANNADIWVHDIARSIDTRVTFSPAADLHPAWSKSGREIVFDSSRNGRSAIYRRSVSATAEAVPVGSSLSYALAPDWSPNGEHVLFHERAAGTMDDIWMASLKPDGEWESRVFLQTPFREQTAKFSPDGRYIAYLSDESGRMELWVRPFPNGEEKWRISENGASQPRWRKDGKEILYVEPGGVLFGVEVTTEPTFSAGSPVRLFQDNRLIQTSNNPRYDVTADGQRIIMFERVEEEGERPPASIHIVENWYEEFRDREPNPQYSNGL